MYPLHSCLCLCHFEDITAYIKVSDSFSIRNSFSLLLILFVNDHCALLVAANTINVRLRRVITELTV